MKINNISAKTSTKATITLSLICAIITIAFLVFYFTSTANSPSITNFFNWYLVTFKELQEFMGEDKWSVWLLFIVLPICLYGGLIATIWERHLAIKEFNSKLNLKSVEFLQGRINFIFNKPQCNISCSYSDIEELKMIIHTIKVHTKRGSYPAVSEIELQFSILNNKKFMLKNTPNNIMNFIYSVIDYSRGMKKFSYCFRGYMEIDHIKEKIEDYLHKGFKQILSNSQEEIFKGLSITFFIIAIVFLFAFDELTLDNLKNGAWILLVIPGIFAIPSFIFDSILIADKIKERKHKI